MQPGQFAWQIFDKKVMPMLRDEYRIKQVTKVRADTLEELVQEARRRRRRARAGDDQGIQRGGAAPRSPFNPNVKDGRGTEGLAINKSNWANTIDEPPFEAYAVTCGITFTFGGAEDRYRRGRVIDTDGQAIPGLYAAGELVGGTVLFQLSGRHRTDGGLSLRKNCRHHGWPARGANTGVTREISEWTISAPWRRVHVADRTE